MSKKYVIIGIIIVLLAAAVAGYMVWRSQQQRQAEQNQQAEELIPADSQVPAAGACAEAPKGDSVAVIINEDGPASRCQKVAGNQFLKIKNNSSKDIEFWFGANKEITFTMKAGEEFESPEVGYSFAAGIHVMHGQPIQGPELWILDENATVRNFTASYLEAYKTAVQTKKFDQVKNYIFKEQLDSMAKEKTPIESNYTQFDSYELGDMSIKDGNFVFKAKLSNKGAVLKNQDGSEWKEIIVTVDENGEYKTKTWYFSQ